MSWKKLAAAVVVTAVLSVGATFLALDIFSEESTFAGGRPASIRSIVLNEDREYFIHLPSGYDAEPARRYPVLYVLDSGSQAEHTVDTALLLARIGAMPPMIVIAVPSGDSEYRNRDYTPPDMLTDVDAADSPKGHGDRFLAFLQNELVVEVERALRTTRPRMLSGWSRSGLFTVYSQIAAPDLFDARFANSPALWRENDVIVKKLEQALQRQPGPSGFLFLSLGDQENEKMTAAFQHAASVLRQHAPATLAWRADLSAGGVHETNPRLSMPVGLHAMFAKE